MKITTVSYEAIANLGNYENEKIRLEAVVEEGDNWEECLSLIRDNVHEQLKNQETYNDYCNRFYEQKRKLEEIVEKLQQAHNQWEQASNFLITQGWNKADVPSFPIEEKDLITAGNEELEPEFEDDHESEF